MEGPLGVRKGAWTKEEDVLLRKCVENFGEGKWHLVPLRAGNIVFVREREGESLCDRCLQKATFYSCICMQAWTGAGKAADWGGWTISGQISREENLHWMKLI